MQHTHGNTNTQTQTHTHPHIYTQIDTNSTDIQAHTLPQQHRNLQIHSRAYIFLIYNL